MLLLSPGLTRLGGARLRVAAACASSASTPADLSPWHNALHRLAPETLRACLPLPHPEGGNWANEEALLGDALLKVALYRALGLGETSAGQSRRQSLDKGRLHDHAASALSNTRLSACAATLLVGPGLLSESDLQALPSEHTRGTCVEAAASAVGTLGGAEADRALGCVAKLLLAEPIVSDAQIHPKTLLIEQGGSVVSERQGGPDHLPLWSAVAKKGSLNLRVGPQASKREAEAMAAEGLLRRMGVLP